MYETILLATDGSSDADAALDHAIELASAGGGALHIISVVETRTAYDNAIIDPEEVRENLHRDAREAVDHAESVATDAGVGCDTDILEGAPPDRILDYADEIDADVIVVGATGRSGFKRLILGGTAERLLDSSPIPVAVIGGMYGDTIGSSPQ